MARKRISKNRAEYEKEKQKLIRRVKSFEKKGYSFGNEITKVIRRNPKRITRKYIDELKSLKRLNLAKKGTYYFSNGGYVSGYEAYTDRSKKWEERKYDYEDLDAIHQKKETEKIIERVEELNDSDYSPDEYYNGDYEVDYFYDEENLSEEAIEKDAYDILTERIEGLNWVNEDEKDYLLRVVGDEYGEYGKPDYKIWADEEWLAEGLPELVIDSPKRKHVLSMIHTNTGGKTSGENVDKVARLFYALSTLRGSENNLTERDYEFLHRYGE